MLYSIYFFGMSHLPIIIGAFAGIVLLLLMWIIRLELKFRRMTAGTDKESLDEILLAVGQKATDAHQTSLNVHESLKAYAGRLAQSVRGIETVRYNPFTDVGGNQSFATAIVDDHGNGVIISSLYGRERVSVFAKPVEGGASPYELTEEEREALSRALKK